MREGEKERETLDHARLPTFLFLPQMSAILLTLFQSSLCHADTGYDTSILQFPTCAAMLQTKNLFPSVAWSCCGKSNSPSHCQPCRQVNADRTHRGLFIARQCTTIRTLLALSSLCHSVHWLWLSKNPHTYDRSRRRFWRRRYSESAWALGAPFAICATVSLACLHNSR